LSTTPDSEKIGQRTEGKTMERQRTSDLQTFILFAGIATAALAWAAIRWPSGLSLFGFESPYSVLQPFQTGFMLAPGRKTTLRSGLLQDLSSVRAPALPLS
jgi:hypothetical protein